VTVSQLNNSSAVADMDDCGHNRHAGKRVVLLCPFRGGKNCSVLLQKLDSYDILAQSHQNKLFVKYFCLQCFDAVGWVAGRALACKKLSGEALAWLSVWSEVQMICV